MMISSHNLSQIRPELSKYLSDSLSVCSARAKPRYLGGAGTYSSVPYDWNGWDTPAAYKSAMDNNQQAGDYSAPDWANCSKGVDCSGFVTRVWGRSDKKYGTSTLSEISTALQDRSHLKEGDIMNLSSSHVRLIRSTDSNGATVYEATVDGNVDRVINRYLSWSSFNSYQPRRYNGLCDP